MPRNVFPMYVGVILIGWRDSNDQLRIPHVCGGDPYPTGDCPG